MEDISELFVLPAVIDVKVGQRTFGPDANEEKMRKETEKYPQQVRIPPFYDVKEGRRCLKQTFFLRELH